jgi:hypothetical protein
MMYHAFVEIRALGWSGRGEEAADLADAFHNLPHDVYRYGGWDANGFRAALRDYQQKYSNTMDYLGMLDRIFPPGGDEQEVVRG